MQHDDCIKAFSSLKETRYSMVSCLYHRASASGTTAKRSAKSTKRGPQNQRKPENCLLTMLPSFSAKDFVKPTMLRGQGGHGAGRIECSPRKIKLTISGQTGARVSARLNMKCIGDLDPYHRPSILIECQLACLISLAKNPIWPSP